MKNRTGKECKKVTCDNYERYSNWRKYLGSSSGGLKRCMNCRYAHVSQYKTKGK